MKKIIFSAVLISFFISCKKESKDHQLQLEKNTIKKVNTPECYLGVIKKDSVLMHLNFEGNQLISGNLIYNFYEKDKNEGSIVGQLKGDTLFADYTFTSEGVLSVREVVFLKEGNNYIEGFGETVDDNKGKVKFKDKKKLMFDGKLVLAKKACK